MNQFILQFKFWILETLFYIKDFILGIIIDLSALTVSDENELSLIIILLSSFELINSWIKPVL